MIKDFAEYQFLQINGRHLFKKRIHCLLTIFSRHPFDVSLQSLGNGISMIQRKL